jgi:hypothetical protein
VANPAEVNKESAERLYDLLSIKKDSKKPDELIARAKASMTKESIAWVEQQIESVN